MNKKSRKKSSKRSIKKSSKKSSYKKLRVKMLEKYDENNDNLITIKEYLTKEVSAGPKARSGNIDYHYQNIINIYNFFTLMVFKKIKEYKIMCIPQYEIIFGQNFIERTTSIYDFYRHRYYFPKSMIKSIAKCKKTGIRLVYFTFIIAKSNDGISHANMVIIDLKKKTLERFEPYGCDVFYNKKLINTFFRTFVLKFLKLKKFKYLEPENLSPKIGVQHGSDSFTGMCVTISAMYLQMRILNVDVKQKKIIDYFLSIPKKKLKKTILKFARYIETTLKKNSKLVNRLNYNLYEVIFNELKNV